MSNIPEKEFTPDYRFGEKSALMTREYLMREYVQNEQSLNQIAKKIGCSKKLVLMNIQKHKVPTRTNGLAEHVRKKRNFRLDEEIKNYVDGLILGDGHIFQKNIWSARFDQHFAIRYRQWTDKIIQDFHNFGIETNTLEYVTEPRIIKKTGQLLGTFSIVMLFSRFYGNFVG